MRAEIKNTKTPEKSLKSGPLALFISSTVVVFVAESLVMLVLYSLELPESILVGLLDAALLSVVVVPALYFLFFKPMRRSIYQLERSEKYQRELEKVDRIKSDFISVAAHELCTPVTAIMGYADLLLENPDAEDREEYLNVIIKKAETLERIIDDLLVLNRYERGSELQVYLEENDLVEILKGVVDHYQRNFPDKPIHLDLPADRILFEFDRIRINQVLDNLLSNAVKYANDIHDPIELTVFDRGDRVEIVVRDEGIGMTPEELEQVYKKFFRANTEKSAAGGLGLGMAIVKNIIESHRGSIDIASQRGVGTTVTVQLPKSHTPQQ